MNKKTFPLAKYHKQIRVPGFEVKVQLSSLQY